MAGVQSKKRQRTDEAFLQDHSGDARPAKKRKTRSEIERDDWTNWKPPPEFYDRLSKIHLTHRALAELDRRTKTQRRRPSPPPTLTTAALRGVLARFARHGGPDLCHLRGCPEPIKSRPAAATMSSRSQSRRTESVDQPSTLPTTTTKTKKSGPYDRNFEMHLADNEIHPIYASQEPNLNEIRAALAKPRPSLSPSRFSEGAFKTFRLNNARAKDEADVVANVIPTILGSNRHASARNTIFNNLEGLTDSIVAAQPDIYYGSDPRELRRPVRDELGHHIIPSTMLDKPLAPNFFVEVKGPDGSAAVAMRQARYDGAVGSRAMHSLQNYGEAEPDYDEKPYTFSSTYHDGQLKMYTHHVTESKTKGGPPEYHMAQLGSYAMTNNLGTYVEGARDLRNAVDLAGDYRHRFIQAANTRAQPPMTAEAASFVEADSTSDEFVDCEDYPAQDPGMQVTNALAAPGYLYDQDDSPPLTQQSVADFDDTFASSFTSSFTESSQSKRRLSPRSSSSKSRKRPHTRASQSVTATGLAEDVVEESFCVTTYWRKGKLYFKDTRNQERETQEGDWTGENADDGTFYVWWRSKSGRMYWTPGLAEKPEKRKRGKG